MRKIRPPSIAVLVWPPSTPTPVRPEAPVVVTMTAAATTMATPRGCQRQWCASECDPLRPHSSSRPFPLAPALSPPARAIACFPDLSTPTTHRQPPPFPPSPSLPLTLLLRPHLSLLRPRALIYCRGVRTATEQAKQLGNSAAAAAAAAPKNRSCRVGARSLGAVW